MNKFLLLICFLLPYLGQATQVRGTVLDEKSEPLPFANVLVMHSTYTAISDFNGRFYLELAPGNYDIIVRASGYENDTLSIQLGKETFEITSHMQLISTELDIVTVSSKAKDPAYAIMKEASKRRKENQKAVFQYKRDSYIKSSVEREYEKEEPEDTVKKKKKKKRFISFKVEKDGDSEEKKEGEDKKDSSFVSSKQPVTMVKEHQNFSEKFCTNYFRQKNKFKEIVTAFNDHTQKQTSGVSISYGAEGMPGEKFNPYLFRQNLTNPEFDFYDNLIDMPGLGPTPFISPLNPTATLTYQFRLDSTIFSANGKKTYQISIIPKRQESAALKGTIYIDSDDYHIVAVDMEINKDAMYIYNFFHLNIAYEKIQDSLPVCVRENYQYTVKEGKETVWGSTSMRHWDYETEFETEKNFFNRELKFTEEDAYSKDSLFWEQRPITLKPQEKSFIKKQDSIAAIVNSPAYKNEQDSIYNQVSLGDIFFNGLGFRNWHKRQEIFFDPLIAQPRPFGVGGYRHNLGIDYEKGFKRGYKIENRFQIDYGIVNNDLKGSIDTRFTYLPKKFGKARVAFGDVYSMLNTYESLSAIFSRANYVRKKTLILGHSMETINGLFVDVDAQYSRTISLDNLDLGTDIFGGIAPPVEFDNFTELFLDITLNYTIRQKYYTEPYRKIIVGSDYPRIKLQYKKGIPGLLESIVDFDFVEVTAEHEFKLGTAGNSHWKARAGRFIRGEDIQLTHYKYFRGSDPFLFSDPLNSLQLLGPTLSTTNAYLMGNYIHHFNGAIMNKIPLIKWLKLESTFGGGILVMEDNGFFHAEAFAGLERRLRIKTFVFKVGVFGVAGDSNYTDADAQIKIGFNFFDAFHNKWMY
jgi:hypothetical protein